MSNENLEIVTEAEMKKEITSETNLVRERKPNWSIPNGRKVKFVFFGGMSKIGGMLYEKLKNVSGNISSLGEGFSHTEVFLIDSNMETIKEYPSVNTNDIMILPGTNGSGGDFNRNLTKYERELTTLTKFIGLEDLGAGDDDVVVVPVFSIGGGTSSAIAPLFFANSLKLARDLAKSSNLTILTIPHIVTDSRKRNIKHLINNDAVLTAIDENLKDNEFSVGVRLLDNVGFPTREEQNEHIMSSLIDTAVMLSKENADLDTSDLASIFNPHTLNEEEISSGAYAVNVIAGDTEEPVNALTYISCRTDDEEANMESEFGKETRITDDNLVKSISAIPLTLYLSYTGFKEQQNKVVEALNEMDEKKDEEVEKKEAISVKKSRRSKQLKIR